jgi:hypothetical protein
MATMLLLRRGLTVAEDRRVSDEQVRELVESSGSTEPPFDIERVGELEDIDFHFLPRGELETLSGATDRVGGRWVISLNQADELWESRLTVAHELKHIIDDPYRELLYPDWQPDDPAPASAEGSADYFARAVLIYEPWLRQAWARGERDVFELARSFATTEQAILTRLIETGLITPWPGIERHHYTRLKVPVVHGWQKASRRYLARERAELIQRLTRTVRPPSQAKARGLRPFGSSSLSYFLSGIDQCPKGGNA